jgi:hypothetical protein
MFSIFCIDSYVQKGLTERCLNIDQTSWMGNRYLEVLDSTKVPYQETWKYPDMDV